MATSPQIQILELVPPTDSHWLSWRSNRRSGWNQDSGNSWNVAFRLPVSGIPAFGGKGDAPESGRWFDKLHPDLSSLRFVV
jgi:hypothetical protein